MTSKHAQRQVGSPKSTIRLQQVEKQGVIFSPVPSPGSPNRHLGDTFLPLETNYLGGGDEQPSSLINSLPLRERPSEGI